MTMSEYLSRITAIDVMGEEIDINSYRVEGSGGTKYGFIISFGSEERGNYEEIVKSEAKFDDGEEARQEGRTLLGKLRDERWEIDFNQNH